MIAIFEQVLILLAFCLVGFLLSKAKIVDPGHSKSLSGLLVYIFLPCTTFNTFSKQFNIPYLSQMWPLLLVSTGLILVVVLFAKLINHFLTKDPDEKAVNEYSLSMANIGYMGYPLAEAVLGEAGLLNVMMFAAPMNVYIGTVGYNMLTAGKEKKSLLKKIFTPSLIGILIGCGVGISGLQLPSVISNIAKTAGNCMAPVSMIITGMTISQYSFKKMLTNKSVYIVTAVRLIIAPLLICALLKLLGLEFARQEAVLLYAMPCGMNAIVYPKLVGKDSCAAVAQVMVSTVLSMFTIPLCLHFLV